MKYSPVKCYRDLLLEYLSMAVGELAFLPKFENYHNEYLKDFSVEELEKATRKFSKKGHTYFAFMVGVTWANCMRAWEKKNKDLNDDELEEFVSSSQAALTSLMSLLGVEDLSSEEIFDFVDTIMDDDGYSEEDDDEDEDFGDDFDEDDEVDCCNCGSCVDSDDSGCSLRDDLLG